MQLNCFCFILLCLLYQSQANTYAEIRKNAYKIIDQSKHFDKHAFRQIERELKDVFDMEKILKATNIDSLTINNQLTDSKTLPAPPFGLPNLPSINFTNLVKGVSVQCMLDGQKILTGIQQSKPWALSMMDAFAKPPSGILNGGFMWLGDYDECLDIKTDSFHGKYCREQLYLAKFTNPLTRQNGASLNAGICVPSSCSGDDILNLLKSVVPQLSNQTIFPYSGSCEEKDQRYDTRAIVVLVILSNFAIVITLATIYDVVIRVMEKRQKQNPKGGIINIAYVSSEAKESGDDYKPKVEEPEVSVDVGQDGNETSAYTPGIIGKAWLSFSVYTNIEKILGTKQGAGTLAAINGIRFISMSWVILGHTFAFGLGQMDNAAQVYTKFIKRKSFMAIMNAEVSVDSFFALSGTLLAYLILQQLQKQKSVLKLNWFMFYFHRFWRLTPPYMLVLMVFTGLYPYLGSGPFWSDSRKSPDNCHTNWWYNLLYINNFNKESNECFGWAWYLANDMQFFVISPIILIPMYYSKIAGTVVTGVMWLGCAIATGLVSRHFDLQTSQKGPHSDDYFNQYYQRPYTRIGPYLVGMFCGFLLYQTKCRCKINKYLNLVLWAVFTAIASAALYGVYRDYNGHPFSTDLAATFNTLHRTAWSLGVCWVIFACATGNGGIINTILSWKAFVPLGKLTYCAYLVHPIVIFYYFGSRRKLIHVDTHIIIYEYLGNLVLAYACAFVASLAFEAPMMGLEKVIFRRGEKK
ncbi:nose resistant to fluoxetine protein 6-like [Mytilus trossulus]|uniref:nose resistant to fluoxetine protein 6-like n=1 Tax=Mytilus trossulus TaxID=6551 RepID=UPI0030060EAF